MALPLSTTGPPDRGAAGRRARQKAATRARLLAAARVVFADGSVVTTPLDAVAAAAGVSKATLFFHFAARTELLEALAGDLYVELYEELTARPARTTLEFLTAYLAMQRDDRPRLLWEIGDVLSADGRAVPDVAYRHLRDGLASHLMAGGIEPGRAARLAGVLGPATFMVARRVAFGQDREDEVMRFLADVDHLVGAAHR